MAVDFSQVDWTRPNNAYYGMDSAGNLYSGTDGQSLEDFALLPVLYNIMTPSGEYTDQLANITLYGYMPADKNIKIPENMSQMNVLTRYSRIGSGVTFKDYSYKDLGSILDTIYSMATNAANAQFFIKSDKNSNPDGYQLTANAVSTFHDMELTTFDSSIGEDILVSTDNQLGDILNGTTISKDSNLFDVLKMMFTKRIIPFTYEAPSVSFSGSANSNVEFGTTVNVTIGYSYTQNDGPNSNLVTASGDTNGSFTPLPSDTSKTFKLTVSWPEGTAANGGTLRKDSFGCNNGIKGTTYKTNIDNKGYAPSNDKDATKDILGNDLSSCSASSASKSVQVSGFYYVFYGTGTIEFTDLSSASIRKLSKEKKGTKLALSCTAGTKALIFASPTKVTSITQKSAMQAESLTSFTKDGVNPWETKVLLPDGKTEVTYYVYKYFTEGELSDDVFTITYN